MKKKAEELKKGDKIVLAGETLVVEEIEISDIGKQGVKKCRIQALKKDSERVIIIRPSNYPFEVK
jgi:translation elongation factor P/translation initiation factor 5A